MGNRLNAKRMRIMLKRGSPTAVDKYNGPQGELVVSLGSTDDMRISHDEAGGVPIPLLPSLTNTPRITAPLDGVQGLSLTPVIQSSIYQGTEYHQATHWQVAKNGSFTDIYLDTGWDTANLTELYLDEFYPLESDNVYYVRCRHRNSAGSVSGWSQAISFNTNQPEHVPIVVPFEWDVIPGDSRLGYSISSPIHHSTADGTRVVVSDAYLLNTINSDRSTVGSMGVVRVLTNGQWQEHVLDMGDLTPSAFMQLDVRFTPNGDYLIFGGQDNDTGLAGFVYWTWNGSIYENPVTVWAEPHADLYDRSFYEGLSVTDTTVVVGDFLRPATGTEAIRVSIFSLTSGAWTHRQTITGLRPEATGVDHRKQFAGSAISADGQDIFLTMASETQRSDALYRNGFVSHYRLVGTDYVEVGILALEGKTDAGDFTEGFGFTLACTDDGKLLCVGDLYGNLYLYRYINGQWVMRQNRLRVGQPDSYLSLTNNGVPLSSYGYAQPRAVNDGGVTGYNFMDFSVDGKKLILACVDYRRNGGVGTAALLTIADDDTWGFSHCLTDGFEDLATAGLYYQNMESVFMGTTEHNYSVSGPDWDGNYLALVTLYR